MLRLILGRAGTGKTALIIGEIRQRVEARQGQNILLVPEQYSHEAERELLRVCGDTASLYAEVLSFTRLAHAVARERGGSAVLYADKSARLLQMAVALEKTAPLLELYGSLRRQPESMAQLVTALDELRSGCADGARLREAASQATGRLSAKLRDMAALSDGMDALAAQGGADPMSRLDALADAVPQSTLLRGGRIWIDGFSDFTARQRRVLRELWLTGEVTVCLSCEGLDDDSEIFALARKTALQLRQAALDDRVEVKILTVPPKNGTTPMGFLEQHLFDYTAETMDAQGAVTLVSAPTAAQECELAAAEVLRLVRETGCRWRDVAVAVRGFDSYESMLRSSFERSGVPLYASRRSDILRKPLPALILSAYEILAGGWQYEAVFAYLKTGLAGLSREETDELENYCLRWNIRGGGWTGENPWSQHPDGYHQTVNDAVRERLARLNSLRERVRTPLLVLQERSSAAGTAREQCRALAAFWEALELPKTLEARSAELNAAGETQLAAETAQLWEKLVTALEQCAAVLGESPMDAAAFAPLFRLVLSACDVGTIPIAVDRVTAGDFDRMRRRSIKHLLILGATDEALPALRDDTGIFTTTEREQLRELRLEVEDEDTRMDREFSLIYQVLSLPSESVWVSRPLCAPDGAETRPSFVSGRLCTLFGLREQAGELLRARAASERGAFELAAGGNAECAAWFADDAESRGRLERLRSAAELSRGRLGREAVRSLYGDKPALTASRIDTLASCKFQYFLRYGLKAKEREQSGFQAPELGTFLHTVLEKTARAAGERGGFAALTDREVGELCSETVREYVHTELEDFREKSPRFVYLFRRLQTEVSRVVLDTARELRRSDFRPLDFELNFSETGDIPPVTLGRDTTLRLTGIADRVDGWEKDGKLYLRIMDYKSGVKKFSFSDVWLGMGLQMLLYLYTLQSGGARHYDAAEIVPAGVLYVPARDVLVSADHRLTEEEILQEKAKKLRRSGLVLWEEDVINAMEHGEDGFEYLPVKLNRAGELSGEALCSAEQLGALFRYVGTLLEDMAAELRRGSITADPWVQGESEGSCVWCSYYDACHFDENSEKVRYKCKLTAPDFWGRLAEREGKGWN